MVDYQPKPLGGPVGPPVSASPAIFALTPVTIPNATTSADVITLANVNKAKINAIIAALKA